MEWPAVFGGQARSNSTCRSRPARKKQLASEGRSEKQLLLRGLHLHAAVFLSTRLFSFLLVSAEKNKQVPQYNELLELRLAGGLERKRLKQSDPQTHTSRLLMAKGMATDAELKTVILQLQQQP